MNIDGAIHRSDLNVREHTTIEGLVMGSVTVAAEQLLIVRGSVARDVILNEGARLEIYGRIGGDIVNRGGKIVHSEGEIGGKVILAKRPGRRPGA